MLGEHIGNFKKGKICETQGYGTRAWKGFDWETMDRLHEKGYISDPKGKAKSVMVSEEGQRQAKELFERYFGIEQD